MADQNIHPTDWDWRGALERALFHACGYIEGLPTRAVKTTVSLAELRARLDVGLKNQGLPARDVIDELAADTSGAHLGSVGGRFFAWVIGGVLPSALAADWLTSTWDQNAVLSDCAPAAAMVEEIAGKWMKEILGLPAAAFFAFTTGCQFAHFVGLAGARHALLAEARWDVQSDGLQGVPRIGILANDGLHASVIRAGRFLGLGTRAIQTIETGSDGRIDRHAFARALAASHAPRIVVLNGGDLNAGACDDFGELIPLARQSGAWVHVDGAFGLWARARSHYRDVLQGVEGADSWATDAHKWLNTSKDCGFAVVRNAAAHRAAMTIAADYISAQGDSRDPIDWTPEWTRRARGFVIGSSRMDRRHRRLDAILDRK